MNRLRENRRIFPILSSTFRIESSYPLGERRFGLNSAIVNMRKSQQVLSNSLTTQKRVGEYGVALNMNDQKEVAQVAKSRLCSDLKYFDIPYGRALRKAENGRISSVPIHANHLKRRI